MLALIALLLGTITILVGVICLQLQTLNRVTAENTVTMDEIRQAQLNPRTRIGGPIGVQSGAVSDEQKLERLGRATIGHRRVVGGDDDSQLKMDLTTSTRRGGDNE